MEQLMNHCSAQLEHDLCKSNSAHWSNKIIKLIIYTETSKWIIATNWTKQRTVPFEQCASMPVFC